MSKIKIILVSYCSAIIVNIKILYSFIYKCKTLKVKTLYINLG